MSVLAFAAIQVEILQRETVGDWVKFPINIITVYKRGQEKVARGENALWLPLSDLMCKCPKVRVNKRYLVLGRDSSDPTKPGIILHKSNRPIVIPWKDEWQNRLRKFQRHERKGKC